MNWKYKTWIDSFFRLPRWLLFAGSLCMLILLGFQAKQSEDTAYRELIYQFEHPAQFAGREYSLGYMSIIAIRPEGVMGMDRYGHKFFIETDSSLFHRFQHVSFRGRLTGQGHLNAIAYQIHPHRRWKYGLSFLSLPLALFLAIRNICWSGKKKAFKIREKVTDA